MAKINDLDKLSFAELTELRDRVDAAMVAAKAAERADQQEDGSPRGRSRIDDRGCARGWPWQQK